MKQNIVFIQSSNLDDLSLSSMLESHLISDQVIKLSLLLSSERKKQFIACRYLLAKILNQHFNIPKLPTIKIGNNNRPQFDNQNLPDFNISHSGKFIAVAISTTGNIGLDIEFIRTKKNYLTIAKQFFSSHENDWLNKQYNNNQIDAFWRLWTLRESALKLYAKGVWQMKKMKIIMPDQKITSEFSNVFYPYYKKLDQIHLSISCNNPIESIIENNSLFYVQ